MISIEFCGYFVQPGKNLGCKKHWATTWLEIPWTRTLRHPNDSCRHRLGFGFALARWRAPFPQTSKHSLLEKGLETPATGILESSCGLGVSLSIVSRYEGFLSLNSNKYHSHFPFLSSFSCHFKLSYFIDLYIVPGTSMSPEFGLIHWYMNMGWMHIRSS